MKLSSMKWIVLIIVVAVLVWLISTYGPDLLLREFWKPDSQKAPAQQIDPSEKKPEQQASAEEKDADQKQQTPSEPDKKDGEEEADKGKESSEKEQASEDKKGGEDAEESKKDENSAEEAGDEKIEDPDPLVSINLNNVEMKNVIQIVGDWVKKPIIPTDDKIMALKITIFASEKLPRSQALSLLQDAVRAKGYIFEHAGDKIYIKPLAMAKLGSIPTLGADEPLARIQDKSQMVEKFFRLDNYSPSKLSEVISPLIAEYGHVTAVEDSGMISVIDTVENLMRIQRIIDQFDVPESEQTVEKVFEVANADVLEIIQVLQLILDKGKSRSAAPRPPAKPGKDSVQPATSIVIAAGQIPLKLVPMPKQKWIIATGSTSDIERVGQWIEKLDTAEAIEQEQTIVQVEFANVGEVVDIVEKMIRGMPGSALRANLIVQELDASNQIVIIGSEENRKMVEKMIFEIDMPIEDMLTQKTFELSHADPDQIKENIEGLFADSAPVYDSYYYYRYGAGSRSNSQNKDTVKVISYPTMNRVTVIASDENMVKITAQIAEWDVPLDMKRDQYRIITLDNSDPVKMSELLAKLFSEDSSSGSSGIMSMIFGRRGADMETKKKIVGSLYGMLTFEPVPDTKKIIVISKIPEAYDVIEKLITELDSREIAEVPQVVVLKYADAEDLCDQLNAILNESGTNATIQRRMKGLSEYQSPTDVSSENSNSEESSDPGVITPWWDQMRSNSNDEMPTSNLIGQVRFIPVHRSKAILVLAPPEYLPAIKEMISLLDQPGKQVMLKAIIVEVDHSKMTSLGVQIATDPTAFGTLGENALSALSKLSAATMTGSLVADHSLNISTLIDLLVKNLDARVLNQPTLWTKDNEEAIFFKGQNVAFLDNDKTNSTGESVTRTFEYKDVGVTLGIRPNITPDKAVDLTINLGISQVESELINTQIALNKLNTTTSLIVEDGETIVLGGILFQIESDIRTKVPLLGDIPLVGGLFRHEDTIKKNNELLVFITPYVIDGPNTSDEAIEQIDNSKQKLDDIVEQLDASFEPLGKLELKK